MTTTGEKKLVKWFADNSIVILRISLGIIFFWFGFLKFFSDLSPAESVAGKTMEKISFGFLSQKTAVIILAVWESLIGIGLIFRVFMRATLLLLFLQMFGTMIPLAFYPAEMFIHFPYAPSLEGQYIIKNLVLISAAMLLFATIRNGGLIADPNITRLAKQAENKKK